MFRRKVLLSPRIDPLRVPARYFWSFITLRESLTALLKDLLSSLRDIIPIVVVISTFQLFVVRQPVAGLGSILIGGMMVVLGLTFFIFGLRLALFPIGESLAHALARKGSVFWLILFSFALGILVFSSSYSVTAMGCAVLLGVMRSGFLFRAEPARALSRAAASRSCSARAVRAAVSRHSIFARPS